MNIEWIMAALAVSHVIGTLTFFFIALANMWVYNNDNKYNTGVFDIFVLFLWSNLWLKAWHSGMWGYFCTPDMRDDSEKEKEDE